MAANLFRSVHCRCARASTHTSAIWASKTLLQSKVALSYFDATESSNFVTSTKKKKKKNAKACTLPTRKGVGRQPYLFVDKIRVRATGGEGGSGCVSMLRMGRKHKRQPDGGHGGDGGSIVLLADPKQHSLKSWSRPHVTALAGARGGSKKQNGANGKNLVLSVPCGVVVRRVLDYDEYWDEDTKSVRKFAEAGSLDVACWNERNNDDESIEPDFSNDDEEESKAMTEEDSSSDEEGLLHGESEHEDAYDSGEDSGYHSGSEHEDFSSDEEMTDFEDVFPSSNWGERETVVVADLDEPGSTCVVAYGGKGGRGSSMFASRHGPLPPAHVLAKAARSSRGDSVALELELKLIADVGLVGFPNAGKSSLLAALSRATPEIAPYPFTTLHPLLGNIEYKDGFKVRAADIPGLIAGASMGRGKGHEFLRHVERTKALMYMVDAAGVDGRDPLSDFRTLTEELSAYGDGGMIDRRSLLVANKMDLVDEVRRTEVLSGLAELAAEIGIRLHGNVLGISAGVTGEGLGSLASAIRQVIKEEDEDRRMHLDQVEEV